MFHLDYVSCLLTVLSTLLVGRRQWQGWAVAGANSVIISLIGVRTGQWGFVPANAFCIAIYLYNIRSWRATARDARDGGVFRNLRSSVRLSGKKAGQTVTAMKKSTIACRKRKHAGDERTASHRIRARRVPNRRGSRTPL
jgi:hypothetical protein